MSKLPALIRSMRLRTLPLSLAGVVFGILIAAGDGPVSATTIVFTLLTTVSLQILSNLCNELGDYQAGVDVDGRNGPQYSLQSGTLTARDLRNAIIAMMVTCCVTGLLMVGFSYHWQVGWQPIGLLLLGAFAIWAAMRYTIGKNPYGYKGLGDIFVFLFFGLVSVMGGYFVQRHTLSPWLLLPSSAIGLFSIGVLNVNNIRDMASDQGLRKTIPLRIGEHPAVLHLPPVRRVAPQRPPTRPHAAVAGHYHLSAVVTERNSHCISLIFNPFHPCPLTKPSPNFSTPSPRNTT